MVGVQLLTPAAQVVVPLSMAVEPVFEWKSAVSGLLPEQFRKVAALEPLCVPVAVAEPQVPTKLPGIFPYIRLF